MDIMMNYRKTAAYILLGTAVVLAGVLGIWCGKKEKLQQGIAEKVLRFHVLANSDTPEDQSLKLKVRDAVGEKMSVFLEGMDSREACEAVVLTRLDEIEETAEQVIHEAGYDYEVTAMLAEVDFPVKTYGNYTFPAGNYEALEVVIGEGRGQNWWCVMYPNMCFSGSVYEVVDARSDEELREVLTTEEYEKVFSEGNYEVRLKCFDFLK